MLFMFILLLVLLLIGLETQGDPKSGHEQINPDKLVGQPVDIASSAYQYRADRKPDKNPPESWLALMSYAKQPLNKPLDRKALLIKQALCGLLWEEIRPVKQLILNWNPNDKHIPTLDELVVTLLINNGSASSWWNNLNPVTQSIKPTISSDSRTYTYALNQDTCGIVVSVAGSKNASAYDVPTVNVLVDETWKKMDIEIEWGFDQATANKDYSGRVEGYDGIISNLKPLADDASTTVDSTSWHSVGKGSTRRGIKASLIYMGTSKWRKVQPFTTQPDDVARSIVTVWTKSGNFSFLAADLENGPILAPEYGFFVRRASEILQEEKTEQQLRVPPVLFVDKMDSIAGSNELIGWGSDDTPWFGGNPSDKPVSVQGINMPARSLAMHPWNGSDVAVGWRSPIRGIVKIAASVTHAQTTGNGIEWAVTHESRKECRSLVNGSTSGTGSQIIPSGGSDEKALNTIEVEPGDMISLVIGPKTTYYCDSTVIQFSVASDDGRVWNLTDDVVGSIHAGNPHNDSQGNAEVWHFYTKKSSVMNFAASEPPIEMDSKAVSAKEYIKELKTKKLKTIRQQIREHPEQTWEGAVTAMCGANLPPHPTAPAGFEPRMQIDVPSERLMAQWNLGVWHLTRHAQKNPVTGKMWFDDFPYGILGAETYMVLAALDLMGSHQAAEDGFYQWVSLPMDPDSKGHHPWALPDRPNGLFTEGHGCLTHAVGPEGWGGHMDGVHAFGPGSIGWALTEHYWLAGDKEWLKAYAPRIKANAEWMLRQRKVISSAVPGGKRLWCKGMQPALQVTPDSGGLWMQFYECEAYYWASIARLADTLSEIDPVGGAKLKAEAEAYRKDLRKAVERSIALSPVVPVRDGTFHSVIPFACYVRGLSTGAWGYQRDGSGEHVGPLYWETVQSAAALISPAGLIPANDVRVQGYLDVLEDRLLLENAYASQRINGDWFLAGWQYQGGLERTSNIHLAGDDIPVFLRSFFNCCAIDILPNDGYIFNEHAVHGPPDKIFEEAAFLERFRNLLVMDDTQNLWLARATPRAWLEQGKRLSIKNAPTHFGDISYEITSDVDHNTIKATIELPKRGHPDAVLLRLRHPQAKPIKSVTVNGKKWTGFDKEKETIRLKGQTGRVAVEARY